MLFRKPINFKKLYSQYQQLERDIPFIKPSFFSKLPHSRKRFKTEVYNLINESINDEDNIKLTFALGIAFKDSCIDESFTQLIVQLLNATWHEEHEDLVDIIFLNNLTDDAFTDPLYKIATESNPYRKYDDELEATLRKCIHALKMINSDKANSYIEQLKSTNNSNVDITLSAYK